jgi:hypothetical protein
LSCFIHRKLTGTCSYVIEVKGDLTLLFQQFLIDSNCRVGASYCWFREFSRTSELGRK